MIEVANNLLVGSEADFLALSRTMVDDTWAHYSVVHAAKEPYHRDALGYTSRAAPKDHPEYLWAHRGNRLILNLIDAPDPTYIPKQIIDTAVAFIDDADAAKRRVLVHCNKGESRAPTIMLLAMAPVLPPEFEEAEERFKLLYPPYNPGKGMRAFAMQHWREYHARPFGRVT